MAAGTAGGESVAGTERAESAAGAGTAAGDADRGGGAAVIARITAEPLDFAALLAEVGTRADGAALLFVGTVRDVNEGREVTRLEYEAYREMAEPELRAIVAEVAARHQVGAVAAAHRVGTLRPGEASVAIAVAAPHRAPCYEASREVIEEIKRRLPVWKREEYADGSDTWVGSADGGGAG